MTALENLFNITKASSESEREHIEYLLKEIITSDRKKLLDKLTQETFYEYNDVFDKVPIDLSN